MVSPLQIGQVTTLQSFLLVKLSKKPKLYNIKEQLNQLDSLVKEMKIELFSFLINNIFALYYTLPIIS